MHMHPTNICLFSRCSLLVCRAGKDIALLETGSAWVFYFILISLDCTQIVFCLCLHALTEFVEKLDNARLVKPI